MLLGSATITPSLWRAWERASCFLLPPPHSHFSLHNLESIYFVTKAKSVLAKHHGMTIPWTTKAAGRNWRCLSVVREGTQTLKNLGKLLQELICWEWGMVETLLKEQEKYKTQYMKHLISKKDWWRGCQRASGATEGRKATGADSLFSRESLLFLFFCHREN